MEKLVSIVIPVYNNEKHVFEAISSIINQTYNNIELLIADDGSTDNSIKIIEAINDPRIKLFRNKENLGALKTWNKLFEKCNGEFIAFQDADDTSALNRIEKQLAMFNNDADLSICGTFAKYVDVNNKFIRKKELFIYHKDIYEGIKKNHQFCGASIMIRKEVYEEIGGYSEYFNRIGGEDYYWSAMIVEKYKSYNIPEDLYIVKTTSDSISRTIRDIKQLIIFDMIRLLISDVRQGKQNWIRNFDNETIKKHENILLKPYINDPSLIYRKQSFIESKNNKKFNALKFILKGISTAPFKIVNYNILIHLIMKFFLLRK